MRDVPHVLGLIWARPRFLVQNLCKLQNFEVNLKQILYFRVIFEKNVHSKIHFVESNFSNSFQITH